MGKVEKTLILTTIASMVHRNLLWYLDHLGRSLERIRICCLNLYINTS